jgi:alpha-D-ribose 1-methylphosphonate 5-triphosphate synthase subunit PhnI
MYISVKGGARAIAASASLLERQRRGDPGWPELQLEQIQQQLGLLADRVIAEASLYDPTLAAMAIRQARGDVIEAVFLLRAYRTTLPRWGYSEPVDTRRMRVQRRISAIFKEVPDGQLLGASFDYTQRLLDFDRAGPDPDDPRAVPSSDEPGNHDEKHLPNPLDALVDDGLIEACEPADGDPLPSDITRDPPSYPLARAARLQMLARGDEGWLLGLAYATQRGYSNSHPFAGEIRHGRVAVEFVPDELGFAIELGEVELTDCQMVNQFLGAGEHPPQFTRGQGLVFGHCERKAMAMALVDRALRADELGEPRSSVMQEQEFVLPHSDNVEASGFVQHLKLPHYVTFESELGLLRALRTQGMSQPARPPDNDGLPIEENAESGSDESAPPEGHDAVDSEGGKW